MARFDPLRITTTRLVRLLNSAGLGAVITEKELREQRNQAGYKIGDEKTINLIAYAGWLTQQRTENAPQQKTFYSGRRTNPILAETNIDTAPGGRFLQRTPKQAVMDARKISNAALQIKKLPGKDETLHCIMSGNYDGFDIVNAVLQLAAPATIKRLDILTLGFNRKNANELISLLDSGQIQKTTFCCSVWYRANEKAVFQMLFDALRKRGHPMIAARSHCKILLFELTDRRNYAVETSANLRSCRMMEQFNLTNSPKLVKFHRRWIEDMIAKNEWNEETR